MNLETVSDDQRDVGRSSGMLLYTLYRELQEVITASVILPRLELIKVGTLLDVVQKSIESFKRQYDHFTKGAALEKFLRHCQKEALLAGDANLNDARSFLTARRDELIELLKELEHFLTDLSSETAVGKIGSLQKSDVARFFWPVLFFSPSGRSSCWTWPPSEKFVRRRLKSMSLADGRPNLYLPTILHREVRLEGSSTARTAVLEAIHKIRGWGNEQEIFREKNEQRVGVSAFEDQVIADYSTQESDRDMSAVYYDLLLGVNSGIQLRVDAAAFNNGDKKDGLLVLCSPILGLFHLMCGHEPSDSTNNVLRPTRSDEHSSSAKLLRDIDACFKETNGPYILNSIGALYLAINKLEDKVDELTESNERLAAKTGDSFNIVGECESIKQVIQEVADAAPTTANVLVQGETGTGKELIAEAVHRASKRKAKRMVTVNCGAIPKDLIESELFGHAKGAFTGATEAKKGKFETADGGTLFLDEVGELPLEAQAKLLRVLEGHVFEPVGGNRSVKVDVRVIAATHCDLEQMVRDGAFRQDLWFRLKVFVITAPPLRERGEDILLLANCFLAHFNRVMGKSFNGFSEEAEREMLVNHWEGNVRELKNAIEQSFIRCKGQTIELEHLRLVNPIQESDDTASESSLNSASALVSFDSPNGLPFGSQSDELPSYVEKLKRQKDFLNSIKTSLPDPEGDFDQYRQELHEAVTKAMIGSPPALPHEFFFARSEAEQYLEEVRKATKGNVNFWSKAMLNFVCTRVASNGSMIGKAIFYVELDFLAEGKIGRRK